MISYYFRWAGYRDCVDVNLVSGSTPVAKPYGATTGTFKPVVSFAKVNNCEFGYVRNPATQCMVLPSTATAIATTKTAQACLDACAATPTCTAVAAVRATNPAGTLTRTPNIPYLKWTGTDLSFSPAANAPCEYWSVMNRTKAGCTTVQPLCDKTALSPGANDFVCYGLVPFVDPLLQVTGIYEQFTDPEDPRFYSTCWLKSTTGKQNTHTQTNVRHDERTIDTTTQQVMCSSRVEFNVLCVFVFVHVCPRV